MQHTNLPMHVTCPVIMIQQFMLYDLSWTFCFTIYDSRLLRDFLISCLLTCTGITYLCVPMLSTSFSMHIFRHRFIDIYVFIWFQIYHRSSVFHLCYWSLPVPIYLNHITWSCTCVIAWARQLALSYVFDGLLSDNPESSYSDPRVWTTVALL